VPRTKRLCDFSHITETIFLRDRLTAKLFPAHVRKPRRWFNTSNYPVQRVRQPVLRVRPVSSSSQENQNSSKTGLSWSYLSRSTFFRCTGKQINFLPIVCTASQLSLAADVRRSFGGAMRNGAIALIPRLVCSSRCSSEPDKLLAFIFLPELVMVMWCCNYCSSAESIQSADIFFKCKAVCKPFYFSESTLQRSCETLVSSTTASCRLCVQLCVRTL